jgi:hypothetical protein
VRPCVSIQTCFQRPSFTKLKRFNANDQADIGAMVRLGMLDHTRFLDRFLSAIDYCRGQAFSDNCPKKT